MYTVYVLYSNKLDKFYIDYTSNLEARFKSHNELAAKGWTIRRRPWEIIYTEEYESKRESMQRERALKSHQGRNYLRTLNK